MAQLFDPLENAKNAPSEIISSASKREIKNILKSYVGFFDPFAEMIQNAMDAVDERKRQLKESKYIKKIWIEVNLDKNHFCVSDNGIGFNEDQFKTFLAPSITYKGDKTRGKKGVGATYLAYGFNYLQIGTKNPEYNIVAELKDGRKWVDDSEGIVSRPFVTDSSLIHDSFNTIERGATFTLKFEGDNVRPKDLLWIGADNAEQWGTILRIKTPLGQIHDGNPAKNDIIKFDIRVIRRDGAVSELTNQDAQYIYPHTVISGCADLEEILQEQQKRLNKGLDASKLPERFKNLNGIYQFWKTNDIKTNLPEHAELVDLYNITTYGYFCYSTKIWDSYNDSIVKLRRGSRILKGGLQLATAGMPQGDLIIIPLTSNIGYQNQSHVVVHFENADPDLGRKGFQPELKEIAENIASTMVNKFKKWRSLLKKDTGAAPSIVKDSDLDAWIKRQEEHEIKSPLKICNENFFKPMHQVSMTAKPCSEQDVIVLFNQLLAGGVIRGIRVMATSQHEQYDTIFRFFINEPQENHIFDKGTNPLGIDKISTDAPFSSKPYILEYKLNLDALIQEFENEEKTERAIFLVVVWEIGQQWSSRYSVTSLLDLDNKHRRDFHGLTHQFYDANSGDFRFNGIVLSELVDYLNDVDGVQNYHQKTYREIL